MSTSSSRCKGNYQAWHIKFTHGSALCLTICLLAATPVMADYQNPAFNRGMGRMSHRDYDGAIIDFGEAIGFNDMNPKNYLMRGECFFYTHNNELAIEDFNKSLQYAPNDSEAYLWRGTAHANLGKDDFAIKDYEQAIRLDPKLADRFFSDQGNDRPTHPQGRVISRNGSAQIARGDRSYENKGLNQNAIRDYKQAMARVYPDRGDVETKLPRNKDDSSITSDSPKASMTLGNTFTSGQSDEGNRPLRHRRRMRDLQRNPGADMHTDPLNNADVSSDQSLSSARNERVVRSLDTDPNRGEFGPPPGTREFRGDPQKTIDNMNDAIKNDRTNPENFYKRAKAYQKLMNVGRAMTDYNDAIRWGPNESKYYLGRASLFNQLGKQSLVQADIERARRCNPDLPEKITFQGEPFPSAVQRSASVPDQN
jgi:tetratricopeptide (TPR) repeat protein